MTQPEPNDDRRILDVRKIDGEPFSAIVEALSDLGADEQLILRNEFEPEPLYGVLEQRGFVYETSQTGPEEWTVEIEHA